MAEVGRALRVAALVLGWVGPASASVPPPPVPVPDREGVRPPYEPPGPSPRAAPRRARAARRAPRQPDEERAAEPRAREVAPEALDRSGLVVAGAITFGDCLDDTCRNHGSGIGFGLGLELLYRLDAGFAFGVGYWAQGVSSQPSSSESSVDPCQPLVDVPPDSGCSATWNSSVLRYRTYGLVGRYYVFSEGDWDPFVGIFLGGGWFQLWGRFDVERWRDASTETFGYELTGPAVALELGTDFFLASSFAAGLLLRATFFAWDTACVSGEVGDRMSEGLGLGGRCGSPVDYDASGLTSGGSPSGLQLMLRGRYTL